MTTDTPSSPLAAFMKELKAELKTETMDIQVDNPKTIRARVVCRTSSMPSTLRRTRGNCNADHKNARWSLQVPASTTRQCDSRWASSNAIVGMDLMHHHGGQSSSCADIPSYPQRRSSGERKKLSSSRLVSLLGIAMPSSSSRKTRKESEKVEPPTSLPPLDSIHTPIDPSDSKIKNNPPIRPSRRCSVELTCAAAAADAASLEVNTSWMPVSRVYRLPSKRTTIGICHLRVVLWILEFT